jgi:hypothetical protein
LTHAQKLDALLVAALVFGIGLSCCRFDRAVRARLLGRHDRAWLRTWTTAFLALRGVISASPAWLKAALAPVLVGLLIAPEMRRLSSEIVALPGAPWASLHHLALIVAVIGAVYDEPGDQVDASAVGWVWHASPKWDAAWGGLLQFHRQRSGSRRSELDPRSLTGYERAETFVPRFNDLHLFRVGLAAAHEVTPVTGPEVRYTVSGRLYQPIESLDWRAAS